MATFNRQPFSPLEFSPDGSLLMVSTQESCWTVKAGNGQRGTDLPRPLQAAAFSPDSRRILGAAKDEHDATLWDARTGATLAVLQGTGVSRVAFSPDGRRAVTVSPKGTVSVFDLTV
jgi:WD40 repeat protein